MRIRGGKKHGRYYLSDGIIDMTSTPSLLDPSTEHGHKHSHTPTVGHFTTTDSITLGDSYFIRRILIFTYLSFALFKHCGEILQA
jgi:hypothetical protein